jgi:heme/copper-type cytochrome/quinol oxidase subunit 2
VIRHTIPALTLAVTLLVAGCSGGESTTTPSSTPPPSSASADATPTESAFTGTEIVVEVTNGKVSPATHRVKVSQGTAIRLRVTSDKADEVHVHGYDIKKDLLAGQQGTLDFTADQSGLFEVELEEAALQLVQLEVR